MSFMNRKTEDGSQSVQPEKQQTSASQAYGQVNDMLKRVQENLKERSQESQIKKMEDSTHPEEQPKQTSQVYQQVNDMLKKVKGNFKQANVTEVFKSPEGIKDMLRPLQEKVS